MTRPLRRRDHPSGSTSTCGATCRPKCPDRGLADKRAKQQLEFTWALVRAQLDARLASHSEVKRVRSELRDRVIAGELTAVAAADLILEAYDRG